MYACMRDDEGKKEGRGKKRYHTLHVFSVFFSVRLRLLRGLEFGAREHENIILKFFLPFPSSFKASGPRRLFWSSGSR